MVSYKVDFQELEWISLMKGVREKSVSQKGKKIRLVEYTKDMELHWCNKGHYGCVQAGSMKIEFKNEAHTYIPGDYVFIPGGDEHKHKAIPLTDKVKIMFIENSD